MMDPISLSLQVLASCVTLWAIWQMGNKSLLGPSLSIVSDFAFVTLNVYQHLWALVPFCGVLLVLHIRNLIKWRRDARRQAAIAAIRAFRQQRADQREYQRQAEQIYAGTKNKGTEI
jgi:hypothetical protein